jgi:N-hydroxyarylamine O-acetyltransferase
MDTAFDLDAYLERIQWDAPPRCDLGSLTGLMRAHMTHIPFENLDVLLGRPVRLDLASVQNKLVGAHRGGYCFEHCTLFAAALDRLGYRPLRHAARVVVFVPRTESPRTHMFLTVALDEGDFVLDPGFGAMAPRAPVPLAEGGGAPDDDDDAHWMVRDGRYWVLRAQVGNKLSDCWASTLEEEHPVDFALGNHYTSTHPDSPFVNRIMLRALTDDGRITVMNRDVQLWRGGTPTARTLADRGQLRTLLYDHFGFDLPELDRLHVPGIPEWG